MRRPSLERLIELNGFTLIRQNKHKVFGDDAGNRFVIASTPSDYRAEINNVKKLKRICQKLGREFITEEPRRKYMEPFNGPKVIIVSPTSKQEPSKVILPTLLTTKRLDEGALQFLANARQEGWKVKRMKEALHDMGYRKPKGNPLVMADVYSFLWANGIKKKTPKKIDTAPTVLPKKEYSAVVSDLTELLSSNLSDQMKEKIVFSIIGRN